MYSKIHGRDRIYNVKVEIPAAIMLKRSSVSDEMLIFSKHLNTIQLHILIYYDAARKKAY